MRAVARAEHVKVLDVTELSADEEGGNGAKGGAKK